MNLSEERSRQKLLDILELLGLSEKNQKTAEQYLDLDRPAEEKLLKETEPQDFSVLSQEIRRKCHDYRSHCTRRGRKEEYGRFARFVAAVGGSTSYYVLVNYGWAIGEIQEYLTSEQKAAVRAEGCVWNQYGVRNALKNLEQKMPKVLMDAMEICYHKSDNAKSLLAAAALYYTKPLNLMGKIGNVIFPGGNYKEQTEKTVRYMEENLTGSLPNVFAAAPSDAELETMVSFIQKSSAKDPFPGEIYRILQGKQTSEYLLTLLAGEAFLAIDHSPIFLAFLRLAIAMDAAAGRTAVLDLCLEIGGKPWFLNKHAQELEDALPISKEEYLRWCLKSCKYASPVKRMVKEHPEVIRRILPGISSEEFQHLLAVAKEMNKLLYQELSSSSAGEFRSKLVAELTQHYQKGKNEARQYLLGEIEIDSLYPYLDEWRGMRIYDNKRMQKIHALHNNGQDQQIHRRAVALECLCMRTAYFTAWWNGKWQKITKTTLKEIVSVLEEEHVPPSYQMELMGGFYDTFYSEKDRTGFVNDCVAVLRYQKDGWKEDIIRLSREGNPVVRFLCIRLMDEFSQEYKDGLLACAIDSSKQVRELLVAVYESKKEWEPEMKAMLLSKKSQEREMAALVIKRWGADAYKEELSAAYEKEKSKKVKELLASCLGLEGEKTAGAVKEQTSEGLAKEILKGGKKRKLSWIYEKDTPFPEVHKADGTDAPEDYVEAILVCYADMSVPGASKEAIRLAESLNQEELAAYMGLVFDRWIETRAEAKKKWVLYAASVHGGAAIIPVLYAQIQEWPKVSRGAMAAEAVKALALNGRPEALLLVDQTARKFKFRQVKTAAADALSYAAEQLGITKAELEDRIVPDLGFNEQMEQIFDYGPRSFKVILTPALELEVYDDKGKRLKNLPAPGKKDEPEKAKAASDAWKLLKKQLKTVVANQKVRLEEALSAERLWNVGQWKALFVKNPVMHQFATGLIWGAYEDGNLKETFRYMEDGSFNTVEEEEYELPADLKIGLIHPIELMKETLSAWKEQLSDYEVTQPMEQLERGVYQLTEEERSQAELTRFGGKVLNCLSLSGKLQNQGWYRGSVQDAGGYYTFYREDGDIGVELEFSGAFVGDENDEVTVYGAKFYRAGTVRRGSYVYDEIKKENQYLLKEVNPRYFSEIVLQLTKATASSTEQLPYPECKNNR
ncbi:MAG TPA: DUF4132 domain-containing protein [Lachnospiraceae bacterium]|nr:DUF4132 domain-containing protein [Lachnospiraceae bacterium]